MVGGGGTRLEARTEMEMGAEARGMVLCQAGTIHSIKVRAGCWRRRRALRQESLALADRELSYDAPQSSGRNGAMCLPLVRLTAGILLGNREKGQPTWSFWGWDVRCKHSTWQVNSLRSFAFAWPVPAVQSLWELKKVRGGKKD